MAYLYESIKDTSLYKRGSHDFRKYMHDFDPYFAQDESFFGPTPDDFDADNTTEIYKTSSTVGQIDSNGKKHGVFFSMNPKGLP